MSDKAPRRFNVWEWTDAEKAIHAAAVPSPSLGEPAPETGGIAQFVNISPIVMEGFPDAHKVTFDVGSQHFDISINGFETKAEAEWMRDMFLKALSKVAAPAASPTPGAGSTPIASSECPVCGVNTPHVHTRNSLARTYREEQLRVLFEKTVGKWWQQIKGCNHGSYGMSQVLTRRISGSFPHIKAGSDADKYMWEPVQLLWEVFCYVPLFVEPALPDDGIPDVIEALEIKRNPFASPTAAHNLAQEQKPVAWGKPMDGTVDIPVWELRSLLGSRFWDSDNCRHLIEVLIKRVQRGELSNG